LVAIGNRGTVLQSGRLITGLEFVRYQRALEPAVASTATLAVNGVVGQAYRLEASTNLMQWTNLVRFTNTAERMFFMDNAAAVHPRRFYRLRPD
jgi:hypothetical protein